MAANVDIAKMQKLLALDLPQVAVANALGCTEGYVSQQLADPTFAAGVATLRLEKLEAGSTRDAKLDKLEDTVIDKLEKSLAYMLKPTDLLNALNILSKVPRVNAGNGIAPNAGQLGQTVQIVIPNVTAVAFVRNTQNEIIEAGNRSLTTLPSHVLKSMAFPQKQSLSAGAPNHANQFVEISSSST